MLCGRAWRAVAKGVCRLKLVPGVGVRRSDKAQDEPAAAPHFDKFRSTFAQELVGKTAGGVFGRDEQFERRYDLFMIGAQKRVAVTLKIRPRMLAEGAAAAARISSHFYSRY